MSISTGKFRFWLGLLGFCLFAPAVSAETLRTANAYDLVAFTHPVVVPADADDLVEVSFGALPELGPGAPLEFGLEAYASRVRATAPAPLPGDARIVPASSNALAAIDSRVPQSALSDVPVPRPMPQQLAYRRTDLPRAPVAAPVAAAPSSTPRDCLATAIYFEARGKSEAVQAALAQVILNRTSSGLYPAEICAVVFQDQWKRGACQFAFACDGRSETVRDQAAYERAKHIADEIMAGRGLSRAVGDATHFARPGEAPAWLAEVFPRGWVEDVQFFRKG